MYMTHGRRVDQWEHCACLIPRKCSTFWRSEFDPVLLAPTHRLQDARVGVRPDVVLLAPAVEVDADVGAAHLDDCRTTHEFVEFVSRLQLHAGSESMRHYVLHIIYR